MNHSVTTPNVPDKKMTKNEMITFLWDLLDDIDTAGDMYKNEQQAYRKYVIKKQRKRFDTGITTDGYTITIP